MTNHGRCLLAALLLLIPFTFGLYYIPESPPWLVYNQEEDLAFRSMSQIRLVGAAADKAWMEPARGASN